MTDKQELWILVTLDDDEWRVPPSCLPPLTTLPAQGGPTMHQLFFDMISHTWSKHSLHLCTDLYCSVVLVCCTVHCIYSTKLYCTSSAVRSGWSSRIFWCVCICPKRQKSRGSSSINNQHIQTSIQSSISSQTYQMWRRKLHDYHCSDTPLEFIQFSKIPKDAQRDLERSSKSQKMVTFRQLLSLLSKLSH